MSISILGRSSTCISRCLTVSHLAALENNITVLEGDRVLVTNNCELRCVDLVTNNGCDSGIPTCERVGILCVSRFGRSFTGVSRHRTVCHLFDGLQRRAIVVNEGDGVLVHCSVVGSCIGYSTCYRNDISIPAFERVGVLCRSSLLRSCTAIYRCFTIFQFAALENSTIFVLEGDGVLVNRFGEFRGVCSLTDNRYDLRIPTCEGVGVLSISRLGRSSTCVCRCLTVSHIAALEDVITILEGDGVLVHRLIVCSGVGDILRHDIDGRCPTSEGVGVLSICSLSRSSTIIRRRCAVRHVEVGL